MRWARGVRARTAWSATLVVAVALATVFGTVLLLQTRQLLAALTDVARQQADQVAARIDEGGLDEIDAESLSATREQSLIQVLDARGSVAAASLAVAGEGPATSSRPGAGQVTVETRTGLPIGRNERFVVVTLGVGTPDGLVWVISAQSLESMDQSVAVLRSLLLGSYPVILMVVGGTAYWLAGRALAPVEAIRDRVARVSGSDQDARVPVPDTGDEVAHLARTMNGMLSRLQAAAAGQRRFVADASHELRSPLATIRGTAELMADHPDQVDWPTAARTVLEEADRLALLVADLLLLASADDDGVPLRIGEVDLDDIVSAEIRRLRALGVHDLDHHVRAARVRGDGLQLARAIRNLVDNAARHAVTTVTVNLSVRDGSAVLEVGDDGPGIPIDQRERVFERFVRLAESRDRDSGGTGLGLAITREIARAHGGTVVALEAPTGTGALLRLTLPVAPAGVQPPSDANR